MIYKELEQIQQLTNQEQAETMIRNLLTQAQTVGLL